MFKSLLMIVIFLLAGSAVAGGRPCSTPEYRQFDFWLGNWNAFDDDGKGPDIARDQICVFHAKPVTHFTSCRSGISPDAGRRFHRMSVTQ